MSEALVNLLSLLEGAALPLVYLSCFLLGYIFSILGKPKAVLIYGAVAAAILAFGFGMREYFDCFVEPCSRHQITTGSEDCTGIPIDSLKCVRNTCALATMWFCPINLVYIPIPYYIARRLAASKRK